MPIDWSKHTLSDLVRYLGPVKTSMVPEFETVALYAALRKFDWPGCFVCRRYREPLYPSGIATTDFLRWGEEVLNAKGETPADVIDGRYVSLAFRTDLHEEVVLPDDDRELAHPIDTYFEPLLARLAELELLDNTPPASGERGAARL